MIERTGAPYPRRPGTPSSAPVPGALRRWLPAGLWAAFLLFLGTRPGDDLPAKGFWALPGVDKAGHALLYGVWGWLVHRARPVRGPRAAALVGALAGLALGLVDEGLQGLVAGRSRDAADLLADAAGAAAGSWLGFRTLSRRAP